MRVAVVNLIPNKGNPLFLKNCRPISVPTADYKILTKTISNRVKMWFLKLITASQSFCISGWNIYDCLHLTRDIIWQANKNKNLLAIVSPVQSGAFDKINHSYPFAVLEGFGFPDYIIISVKTMYKHATATAKYKNTVTSELNITQGVRQGCCFLYYVWSHYCKT